MTFSAKSSRFPHSAFAMDTNLKPTSYIISIESILSFSIEALVAESKPFAVLEIYE